jgi:hypothetical protein
VIQTFGSRIRRYASPTGRTAWIWRGAGLALALAVSGVERADAAATVSICTNQPDCLCITWERAGGEWIEVRCPEFGGDPGWTRDPGGGDIVDPNPGWRGPGGEQPPSNPGDPLSGEDKFAWNKAADLAWQSLRGDRNCCINGKPYYTPNECTKLFLNNPMGRMGADLVQNYVNPRYGQGVKASDGSTPCSQGVSAWTTCCAHDPDVMVCDSFKNLSTSAAAVIVIHETMHVAGQPEDKTSSVGPNDPPTTSQITARIKEACGL